MAKKCTSIKVTVADQVGRLAELADKIKAAGVNILALCAWVEGKQGKLLAVTSDNQKACAAVKGDAQACAFEDGILVTVENKPGALGKVAHKLADAGIGVNLVYATAGDGPKVTIVLHTTDNAKAATLV